MDDFLSRLGVQAVNYAMRCGIALTSSFAIQQCSRLLKTVDDRICYTELYSLQKALDNRTKIISPTLDLIEFRSSRGNVFLGNAAALARGLHHDIKTLGKRLEKAASEEELFAVRDERTDKNRQINLRVIMENINTLLKRIDDDIPLIQLAITASGESLPTSLPESISPSRLLQASMFLTLGDSNFNNTARICQIGPSFTLSLYMQFLGHRTILTDTARRNSKNIEDNAKQSYYDQEFHDDFSRSGRMPIWKEVLHKCRVRLCRIPSGWHFDPYAGYVPNGTLNGGVEYEAHESTHAVPLSSESNYNYHLEIIEDLDDGRIHDDPPQNHGSYDGVDHVGIRQSIPIHQITKIFYTDSGRILNIRGQGDCGHNPVLLLKRDTEAMAPTTSMDHMTAFTGRDDGRKLSNKGNEMSSVSNEQEDINQQLRDEVKRQVTFMNPAVNKIVHWDLPRYLDEEWFAFEVFVEENDASDTSEEGEHCEGAICSVTTGEALACHDDKAYKLHGQTMLDSFRNVSLNEVERETENRESPPAHLQAENSCNAGSHSKEVPLCGIISSLSLLDMLIRLTSLQEFQQTSHLSIPDHILAFFLEEASTTDLPNKYHQVPMKEANKRMGNLHGI